MKFGFRNGFFIRRYKDIYTTSVDYDTEDEKTVTFFKIIQNKLLWAISEQTADELVCRRSDAALPSMGMESFDKKGVSIRKRDVGIAKNYLNESEIKLLGLLVEQYLAFAEAMAQQQTTMYMQDWIQRLDAIIEMNGRELLTHAGDVTHKMAMEISALEHGKFDAVCKQQQFDQNIKQLEADIKKLESS